MLLCRTTSLQNLFDCQCGLKFLKVLMSEYSDVRTEKGSAIPEQLTNTQLLVTESCLDEQLPPC